jgi:hypothetical protein
MFGLLEIKFYNLFDLFFMRLFQSHDPGRGFDGLTLLTQVVFLISSFNIVLIEN